MHSSTSAGAGNPPNEPQAAPDWLLGLWRREFIRFPDGTRDDTTRVHWGQTQRLYVDLRIPRNRPSAKGRQSFAEFSLPELHELAEQKGFAGHIVMKDELCSWIRYMDYRPETGRVDAGRLRIEGETLYEEGDADSVLANAYQEVYHRERRADQLCVSLRLRKHQPSAGAASDATGAILLLIDDCFLFARPRPQKLPQAETLRELVETAGTDRARVHALLDCEVSLGQIGQSSRPWTIDESTLPFREGMPLWGRSRTRLADGGGSLIQDSDLGYCQWDLLETSLPAEQLTSLLDQ